VSYLLDVYGPERFLQLYASTPYAAAESEVAQTFFAVYGEPLDAVWSEALQSGRLCLALPTCQAPVVMNETVLLGRGCNSALSTAWIESLLGSQSAVPACAYAPANKRHRRAFLT
jgi:hypothetical protein